MTRAVPVVLFAYRRPDLVARTLASLRANRIPLLYAFSDGPRDASVEGDVAEVRRLLRAVDWTELVLVEQPRNVGVADSEIGGISRVLDEHEEMISCEDDLEFGPGTYDFLCAALARYQGDQRVMGVTAWNHPRVTPEGVVAPYFCGRMSGLMWGTWRRAWSGVAERTAAELCALCTSRGIDPSRYGDDLVNAAEHEKEFGMWDSRFNLHMLAQRGLFLWPAKSMVEHIGWDARATNSPRSQGWEHTPSPAPAVETVRWPGVREHPGSAELWRRAVNAPPRPSLVVRAGRKLARIAGRGALRDFVWRLRKLARRALADFRLEIARHRLLGVPDRGVVSVGGFRLRVTDGPNAWMQYKDELVRRSYAFTSASDAPVVIDGGANIGMFTLATLRDHPAARITAFEPDPAIFAILRENLDRNGARQVTLVNAALGAMDGELGFTPDGRAGGALTGAGSPVRVRVHRLSRYLEQEVDFLKLNIEGAELDVLQELAGAGRVRRVREMVIEYHGWPGGDQRLGPLLSLLDAHGFRYLVHDQDEQSNPRAQPPFRPPGDEPWFALVFAWREGPAPRA